MNNINTTGKQRVKNSKERTEREESRREMKENYWLIDFHLLKMIIPVMCHISFKIFHNHYFA